MPAALDGAPRSASNFPDQRWPGISEFRAHTPKHSRLQGNGSLRRCRFHGSLRRVTGMVRYGRGNAGQGTLPGIIDVHQIELTADFEVQ